jgi:hypothetical protein
LLSSLSSQKWTKTSLQVVNSNMYVHFWKKCWLEKIISNLSDLYDLTVLIYTLLLLASTVQHWPLFAANFGYTKPLHTRTCIMLRQSPRFPPPGDAYIKDRKWKIAWKKITQWPPNKSGYPRAIESESIKHLSVSHSGLKREW